MSVFVPEISEVSSLGAAMCAAVGSGVYSSLEEVMSGMKPEARAIEPDRSIAVEYVDHY